MSLDAKKVLVDWANEQQNWVRLLVREILASKVQVPENIIEEVYQLFTKETNLLEGSFDEISKLEYGEDETSNIESLTINTLSKVGNVNRLAPDQSIEFNPGMTVVFGENAAGKSGYIRVFKSLGAVRSKELILPDINKTANGNSPTATVQYSVGDETKKLEWTGDEGVIPFNRLSIFDTRAMSFHLDDDLTYVYVPRDLSLFKLAHESIDKVKTRLDLEKSNIKPTKNPFTTRFNRSSDIYSRIETLGPTTDIEQLRKLSAITDEEKKEIETLKDQVQSLSPSVINSKLAIAKNDHEFFTEIDDFLNRIGRFEYSRYNELLSEYVKCKERHLNAGERLFETEQMPGELSDQWRALIQAGESFLVEIDESSYPNTNDSCIYCGQELQSAAVELIKKYRVYVNDTTKSDFENALRVFESYSSIFTGLNVDHLSARVNDKLKETEHKYFGRINELLISYKRSVEILSKREEVDFSTQTKNVTELSLKNTEYLKQLSENIVNLERQGREREEALIGFERKLRNLEAKVTLNQNIKEIEEYVEKAKWASTAETLISRTFLGLLRSLTAQSKLVSEDLLNKDFETLFRQECGQLNAPDVKLHFPGKRGQAARRKVLASNYKLSDVLSEGEQKVIALSDFLAESAIRESSSPIIFDDPVNSLDYKRMEHIVDRIVALSKKHQVIVFTHNIWFATSILSKFDNGEEKENCIYYDVSSNANESGIITKGTHPRWDSLNNIKKKINSLIEESRKLEGEVQVAIVERIYSDIRAWCEVMVEQVLLQKVTQRYQPNVMMTKLADIRVDKLQAAIDIVYPLFEKSCRLIPAHSQPYETLNVRPSFTELEEDWAQLQKALSDYQS